MKIKKKTQTAKRLRKLLGEAAHKYNRVKKNYMKAQAACDHAPAAGDADVSRTTAPPTTFDFHTLPRNARFRHRAWTHKSAVAVVDHTEFAITLSAHRVTYTELARDWEYSYDLVTWKAARP